MATFSVFLDPVSVLLLRTFAEAKELLRCFRDGEETQGSLRCNAVVEPSCC